jgi:hypothetical protein
MKRISLYIFHLLIFIPSTGQQLNSIYDNNNLVSFEKYTCSTDSSFHTSIRPYFLPEMKRAFNYDSIRSSYNIERFSSKKALILIFNRNLFILDKKDFGFSIDPLFDFGFGYDTRNDWSTWTNTRGFLAEGYIGKKFAFSTSFYETQAKLPLWIDNYIITRNAVPGQGGMKPYGNGAWDYANASGYISYSPSKVFNFQLGHGKHFWGDGYRTAMLSDFSLYYPYLSVTANFWKIKYIILYSQFTHPDLYYVSSGDKIFYKKFSTMHYLSFVPGKRWNISLFESIIWQASDSTYKRGFELSYINPIIFFRPVEFNLGSGDNVIAGMNLRFTAVEGIVLYGQFVIDEMMVKEFFAGNGWAGNKFAWQLGVKTFDLFGIQDLSLQAEANLIRPYMYSHYNLVQNYSNAREPLAHPSGANTKEAVVIGKYNYKRLYFNLKYVWEGTGLDSAGISYGKNIFRNWNDHPNEYGNYTGQGLYTTMNQLDLIVSFLVNPSTNMNLFAGVTFRRELNTEMDNRYTYFSFGFRTSLRNLYYDFY